MCAVTVLAVTDFKQKSNEMEILELFKSPEW
jgi:hypothetical protein